jgi:hypothetical protein
MRDNNILTRYLKPAGRAMAMPWLNWRCRRTSHAVWLKLAGADVKDAQGQMRHSRASTTMDTYQQFVAASQRSELAGGLELYRMLPACSESPHVREVVLQVRICELSCVSSALHALEDSRERPLISETERILATLT